MAEIDLDAALPYEQLSISARRRLVLRAAIRAGASTAVLVALYYLIPLDRPSDAWAVTGLLIGLLVVVGIVAWQVRGIIGSPFPRLRAIQAVFLAFPLYVLLFAATYVVMSKAAPANFSESLSRTDALYLSVTIVSTVGFGDIDAKTGGARLVVTAQMIGDLILLGLGLRLLIGAIHLGEHRHVVATPDQEAAQGNAPTDRANHRQSADRPEDG